MTSFCLAWVTVTLAKNSEGELEFSPAIFLFTGLIDALIFIGVAQALKG